MATQHARGRFECETPRPVLRPSDTYEIVLWCKVWRLLPCAILGARCLRMDFEVRRQR